MRFWDTSAVVPLVTKEDTTQAMTALVENDPEMIVSCFTDVEVASAIWRQSREKKTAALQREADALLRELERRWLVVDDIATVTKIAREVLSRYPLKAADALQLASALSVVGEDKSAIPFVTLDDRLGNAARSEGFDVLTA